MKLLVSDYDETLYTGKYRFKMNMKKINKFMNAGNKFVIATTNSYSIMKKEISNHKINYNYLSLSNGLIILDHSNQVVQAKYIDKQTKDGVISLLEKFISVDYCTLNEYNKKSDENTTTIKFNIDVFNYIWEIRSLIKKYYPNLVVLNVGKNLYIRKRSNKIDSVDIIKNLENINISDIYTVGDGIQDLEMIREYNGYCMLFSDPRLYKESKGIVTSVRSLVKKIENY